MEVYVMKITNKSILLVLSALLLLSGCGVVSPNSQAANPDPNSNPDGNAAPFSSRVASTLGLKPEIPAITIPAGTPIGVRLQSSISSASANSGDHFDAVIDEDVVVDGHVAIPKGANATGRIVAAKNSGRLHNPGYLRLALDSVSVNGKEVPVQTSSIFAQGASHKKRNLVMIGGGTAAGALIGGLAAGPKGALIGSAIGAGAGTGTAYGTGKKEVGFAAERRLTFRVTQPLTIS
jgi:hypothetical protein